MSKPPKASPAGPRGGLSPTSLRWLDDGDPARRKVGGQYLTPRPVAEALIDRVDLRRGMKVLDPGVGTGELLRAVLDREPGAKAFGWDVDVTAIEAARELVPEADLEVKSALEDEVPSDPVDGFDLVVGNPPYFQLRLEPADRERFAAVISGRANIFALFFQIGLGQLRPGGTLAYIVPPSMNSGAYFEGLREYLTSGAGVCDLTILEGTDIFEGANTAAQLLVLKKDSEGQNSNPQAGNAVGRKTRSPGHNPTHREFVFRREVPEAGFRRVIFSPDPARLESEFEGRRTIWESGLEAVTGQVIWNENRDRLVEEPGPGRVRLVWSHDIGEGELREVPGKEGKPAYYDTSGEGKSPLTGPAIVVNRVVGAVGRGELRAALIPAGEQFLAENHVNVIRPRSAEDRGGSGYNQGGRKSDPPVSEVDWGGVLASLLRPGLGTRVQLLTGNTQISAKELTHLLPLDRNPGTDP